MSDALSSEDPQGTTPNVPGDSASNHRPAERTVLWLYRADRCFVAGLLLLAIALLGGGLWAERRGGMATIEIDRLPESRYEYRLNINQANWVEWSELEGIGETLARRIVADREQRGPFPTIESLQRVKGLGPKILERLRPFLEVTPQPDDTPPGPAN